MASFVAVDVGSCIAVTAGIVTPEMEVLNVVSVAGNAR